MTVACFNQQGELVHIQLDLGAKFPAQCRCALAVSRVTTLPASLRIVQNREILQDA